MSTIVFYVSKGSDYFFLKACKCSETNGRRVLQSGEQRFCSDDGGAVPFGASRPQRVVLHLRELRGARPRESDRRSPRAAQTHQRARDGKKEADSNHVKSFNKDFSSPFIFILSLKPLQVLNGHGIATPFVVQVCDEWGNPTTDQRVVVRVNSSPPTLKVSEPLAARRFSHSSKGTVRVDNDCCCLR